MARLLTGPNTWRIWKGTDRRMICYVLNLERHQARLRSFLQQFDGSDLTASELRRFRAVDAPTAASQRYLVMEDDAILPSRLLASVNKAMRGVPAGWDILLLGCRTTRPSMVTKHATHVDIRLFQGTHAYLVSKAAVRKIFE